MSDPARSLTPNSVVPFGLDGAWYGLEVRVVERILPLVALARLPNAPAIALGAVNIHGDVVPVVNVRRRLGLPPGDEAFSGHLLVARTTRRRLAFPVDQVGSVRDIGASAVIPPDTLFPGLRHLKGIVALPDGLLFIQDLDAFLGLDEEKQLEASLDEVAR